MTQTRMQRRHGASRAASRSLINLSRTWIWGKERPSIFRTWMNRLFLGEDSRTHIVGEIAVFFAPWFGSMRVSGVLKTFAQMVMGCKWMQNMPRIFASSSLLIAQLLFHIIWWWESNNISFWCNKSCQKDLKVGYCRSYFHSSSFFAMPRVFLWSLLGQAANIFLKHTQGFTRIPGEGNFSREFSGMHGVFFMWIGCLPPDWLIFVRWRQAKHTISQFSLSTFAFP